MGFLFTPTFKKRLLPCRLPTTSQSRSRASAGEVVSLSFITSVRPQERQLLRGLYSFRNHRCFKRQPILITALMIVASSVSALIP